jgi:hypothetical protein
MERRRAERAERFREGFANAILLVILIALAVMLGIGAYMLRNGGIGKLLEGSKVNQLLSTFENVKTGQINSYQDTGFFAGMTLPDGSLYPFPDGLLYKNAVPASIRPKWKGPYLKTEPECPYSGCTIEMDFRTGAATSLGQVAQYFIVARRVPIQAALNISRKLNGNERANTCTTSIISNVVQGREKPCVVYLSRVSGAPNTPVDVYYNFFQYSY